jgi:hypothetical protein
MSDYQGRYRVALTDISRVIAQVERNRPELGAWVSFPAAHTPPGKSSPSTTLASP